MTKVFRINTSQLDGVASDENNSGRILSKGEAGFYDNNFGKLELVVGDGVNTHLKNKILGKGVFYGGNADSGDGSGFDTIKLIPDAALHFDNANYGNHQYLIIDPTDPNHIHIRAGGAQDGSMADLFLGAELTNVRVSDNYDNVTIRTSNEDGGSVIPKEWIFDNNGGLSFPMGGAIEPAGMGWIGLTNGQSGSPITILQKSVNLNYVGQTLSEITLLSEDGNSAGNILFTTQDLEVGTLKQWTFGYDGSLTFPDNTVQTTAYTGVTTVAKGASTTGSIVTAVGTPTSDVLWMDGTYNVFFAGGGTVTVDIALSAIANITVAPGTLTTWSVGDAIGFYSFSTNGGGADLVLTVDTIVPNNTPLDLTKTINKLADGIYSLADGVEGQIMYLVAQDGTIPGNVQVSVANSRIAGTLGSATLLPFRIYENSGDGFYEGTGLCTLIFTDGAWQQTGGAWD